MTPPRQILRGTSYLMTRRCTQRMFLLTPSPTVNEIFRFVLAHAAHRHRIKVHAYCVMSNHYHVVVTDPEARLPAFAQTLHSLVARALNAHHGRWENFWDPRGYSAVSIPTPADVATKIAYTLANPVAARLVPKARTWPGLWSAPESIGAGPVLLERPKHFFDPDGDVPAKTELSLVLPAGFPSAGAFRARLSALMEETEAAVARAGGAFLGAARVLAQSPFSRPASSEERRALSPRVSGRDRWKRIEALLRLKEFVHAHRDAFDAWREGLRSVVFPEGTYLMRVVHGAACAGAG